MSLRRSIRTTTVGRPVRPCRRFILARFRAGIISLRNKKKERFESHPGFLRSSALLATLLQGNLDIFLFITSRLSVSYFKVPSLPLQLTIPGSLSACLPSLHPFLHYHNPIRISFVSLEVVQEKEREREKKNRKKVSARSTKQPSLPRSKNIFSLWRSLSRCGPTL